MDDLEFGEIVRVFAVECEEHAHAMEEALLTLERNPADADALRAVFRGAHTLKGNASTLGFRHLTEFAHVLEDLLAELGGEGVTASTELVSLLLRSVDAMRELVAGAVAGSDELAPSHRELMARLASEASALEGAVAEAPTQETLLGSTPAAVAGRPTRARTLRVDVEKLDRLLDLAGEIAVARARVGRRIAETAGVALAEAHAEGDRLQLDLQELVMQMRMVPVGPTFRQFVRLVRDVAADQGKQVQLDIEGDDVEVDTSIIEQIKDPLTHMVRNALDHGIELPTDRERAGKSPTGRIVLRASHRAGSIVIEIADDGAGLNRARIAERARALGIHDADALPDRELFRLIFEPGFSTASAVSELSGRGVGMDVVRRNIEALRGTVEVDSPASGGTTVTLRLPLTLAIVAGFGVGVGSETYLLPLDAVTECLQLPASERDRFEPAGVLDLRGRPMPYLRLRDRFQEAGARPERESVVVVSDGEGEVGLVVDRLLGEHQAVIKPLGRMLHGLPNVAGTTTLSDGRVALLLDVAALLRESRLRGALDLTPVPSV